MTSNKLNVWITIWLRLATNMKRIILLSARRMLLHILLTMITKKSSFIILFRAETSILHIGAEIYPVMRLSSLRKPLKKVLVIEHSKQREERRPLHTQPSNKIVHQNTKLQTGYVVQDLEIVEEIEAVDADVMQQRQSKKHYDLRSEFSKDTNGATQSLVSILRKHRQQTLNRLLDTMSEYSCVSLIHDDSNEVNKLNCSDRSHRKLRSTDNEDSLREDMPSPSPRPSSSTFEPTISMIPTYTEKCYVCKTNILMVEDPYKPFEFIGGYLTSCGEIEFVGKHGYIPSYLCMIAIEEVEKHCSCISITVPSFSLSPSVTQNSVELTEPTLAPMSSSPLIFLTPIVNSVKMESLLLPSMAPIPPEVPNDPDVKSQSPSIKYSFVPSPEESHYPTIRSSLAPSNIIASTNPTVPPSETETPSNIVLSSIIASAYSTVSPTSSISQKPTTRLSLVPSSIIASTHPTLSPTTRMSRTPSLSSSVTPSSIIASTNPTASPSSVVSRTPTSFSSLFPSIMSSTHPTVSPTITPTASPTITISQNPTKLSSLIPSNIIASTQPTVSLYADVKDDIGDIDTTADDINRCYVCHNNSTFRISTYNTQVVQMLNTSIQCLFLYNAGIEGFLQLFDVCMVATTLVSSECKCLSTDEGDFDDNEIKDTVKVKSNETVSTENDYVAKKPTTNIANDHVPTPIHVENNVFSKPHPSTTKAPYPTPRNDDSYVECLTHKNEDGKSQTTMDKNNIFMKSTMSEPCMKNPKTSTDSPTVVETINTISLDTLSPDVSSPPSTAPSSPEIRPINVPTPAAKPKTPTEDTPSLSSSSIVSSPDTKSTLSMTATEAEQMKNKSSINPTTSNAFRIAFGGIFYSYSSLYGFRNEFSCLIVSTSIGFVSLVI